MESIENQIPEDSENEISKGDFNLQESKEPRNGTLLAKIHNFSDENIHKVGNLAKFNYKFKYKLYLHHVPKFYCNGSSEANKGYVSVLCNNSIFYFDDENYNKVIFIISVVDSEGNTRFTQSFFVENEDSDRYSPSELGFKKYVSRETLLSQSKELLPNDVLTLRIEVYREKIYDFIYPDEKIEVYLSSCLKYLKESNEYFLVLDSELGKHLCEESTYFKRMSETPMLERKTGQWTVCDKEYHSFRNVSRIVLGAQYIKVSSIRDVYSMYVVADKYDIPLAKEICRHLFRKYICDGNVTLILDAAHAFEDDGLKEIVERFHEDSNYRNRQNEINSDWSAKSGLNYLFQPIQCISDFEGKAKPDFYC